MRWSLWHDGQLSWGFVGSVVFATVLLIAHDLAWRLITVQFETLLICGIAAGLAAAVLLIVAVRLLSRRPQR